MFGETVTSMKYFVLISLLCYEFTLTRSVAICKDCPIKQRPNVTTTQIPTTTSVPADHYMRIVGGLESDITNFPYQASLQFKKTHVCGATIIHPRYCVTAAHCNVAAAANMFIRVGNVTRGAGTMYSIASLTSHPGYKIGLTSHDICVITMKIPILLDDLTVQPVAIPEQDEIIAVDEIATVSGWGLLNEKMIVASPKLMYLEVPVIHDDYCSKPYGSDYNSTTMLCAGHLTGGKDACQGDSGGPLVANNKLFGVVSFGSGCAQANKPGVYTKVAFYTTWISNIITQNLSVATTASLRMLSTPLSTTYLTTLPTTTSASTTATATSRAVTATATSRAVTATATSRAVTATRTSASTTATATSRAVTATATSRAVTATATSRAVTATRTSRATLPKAKSHTMPPTQTLSPKFPTQTLRLKPPTTTSRTTPVIRL